MRMYTYVHACMHVCMCVHSYVCMHVYMHVYTNINIYGQGCQNAEVGAYRHMCVHLHVQMRRHTYIDILVAPLPRKTFLQNRPSVSVLLRTASMVELSFVMSSEISSATRRSPNLSKTAKASCCNQG